MMIFWKLDTEEYAVSANFLQGAWVLKDEVSSDAYETVS